MHIWYNYNVGMFNLEFFYLIFVKFFFFLKYTFFKLNLLLCIFLLFDLYASREGKLLNKLSPRNGSCYQGGLDWYYCINTDQRDLYVLKTLYQRHVSRPCFLNPFHKDSNNLYSIFLKGILEVIVITVSRASTSPSSCGEAKSFVCTYS